MTPIRVLHLITGLDVGGAEVMLARLVRATDRRRFRVRVVSMTPPGPIGERLSAEGIEVATLGMRRAVPDPRGLLRLLGILQREPVDVLQTWLYHADLLGVLAAMWSGTPRLVWNLRCSDMDLAHYSMLSALLPRLLAQLARRPDVVLVNSAAGKAAHERLGYRPQRWEILPNGVDVDLFRPDPEARARLRSELGLSSDSFVICLPARFDPMKDHATFIGAAARLAQSCPASRFLLVGRGNERHNAELGRLVEASGCADRLMLLGERQDMPSVFVAADVVTLSSSFGEGFPNVIAEAMACATPVVTTDVGDAAAIVGTAGIVVPRRDSQAMAAAWQRCYERDGSARNAMGLAGRRRIAELYGLPAIVARYERLYSELAQDAR